VPDAFDPAKIQLALREGGIDRPLMADSLQGGSIAGLLRFQNNDLTVANNLLGQMATAVSGALNKQQHLGLDLSQPSQPGGDLFSVGAARVLDASSNVGNAKLSVTVTDPSQAQASDYSVKFDGTNYTVTRLTDNRAVAGSPVHRSRPRPRRVVRRRAAAVEQRHCAGRWTASCSSRFAAASQNMRTVAVQSERPRLPRRRSSRTRALRNTGHGVGGVSRRRETRATTAR